MESKPAVFTPDAPAMPARRKLLIAGAGMAAASLIPQVNGAQSSPQSHGGVAGQQGQPVAGPGRRKLGDRKSVV